MRYETVRWLLRFDTGEEAKGMYLTEWRLTHKKWLIVNDISSVEGARC